MMDQAEKLLRKALHLQGYRSRHVRTSVGRLHVLETEGNGSLPPLVLVHGLSSMGLHYLPMLPALRRQSRRLILPDLPGHGFSDMPPKGTLMPELERGLLEGLDAVIDEPAILFGNSLGGAAAIRYTLARPERVRGLVVCSPAGAQCTVEELERVIAQFRIVDHSMALNFVDRLFTDLGPMRHVIALGVRYRFARSSLQDLISSFRDSELLTPEQLMSVTPPTLLIWGRNDRILPRSHLEFFRSHLPPGTRIEEPEHVGHAPYLESPGVLTRSVLRFMRELQDATLRPDALETAA